MDYCEAYVTKLDLKEAKRARSRAFMILQKQDEEMAIKYEAEHANGYCPICHCLRAANGKCMNGCED